MAHSVPMPSRPKHLLLEPRAARRVFYDLDTPVTLERLARGEQVPYIGPRGLSPYDLVLSFSGGASLDQLRSRLGAAEAVPLYGNVDPDVHQPVEPVHEYRCDLSYRGTYSADRQDAVSSACSSSQPIEQLSSSPTACPACVRPVESWCSIALARARMRNLSPRVRSTSSSAAN
jgi:hypothetical protein